MLARASVHQCEITTSMPDLRSMRIRDFSVAPLPLVISQLPAECEGHTASAPYQEPPYPPLLVAHQSIPVHP
jgi:hypothetical protein